MGYFMKSYVTSNTSKLLQKSDIGTVSNINHMGYFARKPVWGLSGQFKYLLKI